MRGRLIVASNRSLEEEVAAGRFRADLYYRLNVIGFSLPPLRERPNIIQPLARQFIAEFAARNGHSPHGIAGQALHALEQYYWPGNIRELRNVIERAVALCAGEEIQVEDLPDNLRRIHSAAAPAATNGRHRLAAAPLAGTLASLKEEAELARLTEVLRKHGKNRRLAAHELGISRTALYNKMHKYGLRGLAVGHT